VGHQSAAIGILLIWLKLEVDNNNNCFLCMMLTLCRFNFIPSTLTETPSETAYAFTLPAVAVAPLESDDDEKEVVPRTTREYYYCHNLLLLLLLMDNRNYMMSSCFKIIQKSLNGRM
jgi:hypothetical protein